MNVCIGLQLARYVYGAEVEPELRISQLFDRVKAVPNNGFSGDIYEEITFFNRDVAYEVCVQIDPLDESTPARGGVRVLQGTRVLAQVMCKGNTVDLAPHRVRR